MHAMPMGISRQTLSLLTPHVGRSAFSSIQTRPMGTSGPPLTASRSFTGGNSSPFFTDGVQDLSICSSFGGEMVIDLAQKPSSPQSLPAASALSPVQLPFQSVGGLKSHLTPKSKSSHPRELTIHS